MKANSNRIKERTVLESFLKLVHDYAYFETITIVTFYLLVGYAIDDQNICILNSDISYILILLAVITLFHGFENGMLALSIIAFTMWFAYPSFAYVEFLVALLMTMIFSEFHYYWTKKIKKAEINAEYRGTKLDELSKAFYTLKISHDQLEKNYVIKPMSIRNSIETIIYEHDEINKDDSVVNKKAAYYRNFLSLLEKSFNVSSAVVVYRKKDSKENYITKDNSEIVYGKNTPKIKLDEVVEDYLVDRAIGRHSAIYISDDNGEPTVDLDNGSLFVAAIPSVRDNKVEEILAIERIPFMAFNRENLTSISILLEYFTIEIRKNILLEEVHDLEIIQDDKFKFEYERLKVLYKKYKVNSIMLVLRVDNELQATRVYEKIEHMLRSLDMVTMIEENGFYYITLLFPLHDEAAALGYLNRLKSMLQEEKDKEFDFMTFDLSQTKLLNKYYREDYGH